MQDSGMAQISRSVDPASHRWYLLKELEVGIKNFDLKWKIPFKHKEYNVVV